MCSFSKMPFYLVNVLFFCNKRPLGWVTVVLELLNVYWDESTTLTAILRQHRLPCLSFSFQGTAWAHTVRPSPHFIAALPGISDVYDANRFQMLTASAGVQGQCLQFGISSMSDDVSHASCWCQSSCITAGLMCATGRVVLEPAQKRRSFFNLKMKITSRLVF